MDFTTLTSMMVANKEELIELGKKVGITLGAAVISNQFKKAWDYAKSKLCRNDESTITQNELSEMIDTDSEFKEIVKKIGQEILELQKSASSTNVAIGTIKGKNVIGNVNGNVEMN